MKITEAFVPVHVHATNCYDTGFRAKLHILSIHMPQLNGKHNSCSATEARCLSGLCWLCGWHISFFIFQRAWRPRAGRQTGREGKGQCSVSVDGYVKWKASACLTWCLLKWKQRGSSVCPYQMPLATAQLDIVFVWMWTLGWDVCMKLCVCRLSSHFFNTEVGIG